MPRTRFTIGLLGIAATLLLAVPANAALYGFTQITNNGAPAASGQFLVDVTDAGSGKVAFKFTNQGPVQSSITQIYFDDGTLLGVATIADSGSGVEYEVGGSPANLPGGNSLSTPFVTTAGFLATPKPPVQPNGVNNTGNEFVTITFNLINGKTYTDTLAALAQATGTGGLRIGLHVQGYANGASESFVNKVPDGGLTLSLLGLGLTGIGLLRRRLR